MMDTHEHTDESKQRVCEQLGEDIDAELCTEVARHLEDCPDCRAQFDSIRRIVYLYRKEEAEQGTIPTAVKERLFKVLLLQSDKGSPGRSTPSQKNK
jgi:hypothetical protein